MSKKACSKCGKENRGVFGGIVCILRHGRTEMNDAHIIIGSIDDPLNERGRMEAERAALVLKKTNEPYDFIINSPLSRAQETADIIGDILSLKTNPEIRLRERCVGEYEGKPEFPEMLKKFMGEEMPTHGAEPLHIFKKRVIEVLEEISATKQKILIITHALPLLVIVAEIKGYDLEKTIQYQLPQNCVPIKFHLGNSCVDCGGIFYES